MMHYVSHDMRERIKIRKQAVEGVSPWQKLANAIVKQAVADYRMEQARIQANPHNSEIAKAEIGKLERFFRSQWFVVLTAVDGQLVLSRLKKEAA